MNDDFKCDCGAVVKDEHEKCPSCAAVDFEFRLAQVREGDL